MVHLDQLSSLSSLPSPPSAPPATFAFAPSNHSLLYEFAATAVDYFDSVSMHDVRIETQMEIASAFAAAAIVGMCVCAVLWALLCKKACVSGQMSTHSTRLSALPKGTEPDTALDDHQDELADTDSIDEPVRPEAESQQADEELQLESSNTVMKAKKLQNGQQECCNKMAEALENGAFNGEAQQVSAKIKGKQTTKHTRLVGCGMSALERGVE